MSSNVFHQGIPDSSEDAADRPLATHRVTNQPPPMGDHNPFDQHPALSEALRREGGAAFEDQVRDYAALAATEIATLGFQANENPPRLRTHDRYGRRIDQVEFHPAYHRLMELGLGHGLAALTWRGKKGARVARAALMFVHNQFEAGTMCPITMTHAVLPSLRLQPEVAAEWEPRVLASEYDPRFLPPDQKKGVTLGMAMTEKQGGSDVRANTTRATPLGPAGPGQEYELVGHKWFCSAPMSDAFLTLAQTSDGLSCFLVPRWRPDGQVNPFNLMRLKDKLGNRSNASSEVEFPGTWGVMIGEPGRGVATIIRMVAETRMDCVIGSASLMRQAVAEAIHHCDGRMAFGKHLSRQPLMMNVLADLAIESEAATATALYLAGRYERGEDDESARLLTRIATPVAKYWVCKRAVNVCNEAQECLGGIGYVEETMLPRLYREAPLNAIWEGSGNIQCLDVLRAIEREPRCLEALFGTLEPHAADHDGMDATIRFIKKGLDAVDQAEQQGRRIVEAMAVALQGAVLIESGSTVMAEAFCDSRLSTRAPGLFGTLDERADLGAIIARARPHGH